MTKEYSAVLIVPWWKKLKMKGIAGDKVFVIQEFEDIPEGLEVKALMVDIELKNHWSEETDDWFWFEILPYAHEHGGIIAWCKEAPEEESDQPDAKP